MEFKSATAPRRFYYGWVIVGLAMLSMAYWFGLRTTFSLFFAVLIDHFHWGRAEAAAAQSINMIAYMIMAPIVGSFVDKIGPRKVILPGIVLTGLGLLLCTQIQTLGQFYLFFGVMVGMGVTCLSIVPFTVILPHWFDKNRGMANGLAGIGIGIGPVVFVPLIQYLISFWGWRFAFFAFALLVLTIPLSLNAFFLRHRPEELGLVPDGEDPHKISKGDDSNRGIDKPSVFSPTQREWMLKDVMKTFRFWAVIIFPSLAVFGVYMVMVHQVRYLMDLGLDKIWAAFLFAEMSAISAGFRFFWGWLSDRIGREITYTLGGICFSLGILGLLLFEYVPSYLLLYLFAFFFGAGWGSTAPMIMTISGDLYKGKIFGLIYGMVEGTIGIGAAFGTWIAGYIYDQTQSYFWAFLLAILLDLVSILLVWLAAPRKVRPVKTISQ
jgi:MFS family permease